MRRLCPNPEDQSEVPRATVTRGEHDAKKPCGRRKNSSFCLIRVNVDQESLRTVQHASPPSALQAFSAQGEHACTYKQSRFKLTLVFLDESLSINPIVREIALFGQARSGPGPSLASSIETSNIYV